MGDGDEVTLGGVEWNLCAEWWYSKGGGGHPRSPQLHGGMPHCRRTPPHFAGGVCAEIEAPPSKSPRLI